MNTDRCFGFAAAGLRRFLKKYSETKSLDIETFIFALFQNIFSESSAFSARRLHLC
jgi:hypothetical protein